MAMSAFACVWVLILLADHNWSVRAAVRALTRTVSEAERWGADANGFYGSEPLSKAMVGTVPIELRVNDGDPWASQVRLCTLDFEARRQDPSGLPMFRFWTKRSQCGGSAQAGSVGYTTQLTLGQLRAHLERTEEDWVARFGSNRTGSAVWRPDGMVFHEARVGSTLVANMLQAIPRSIVYSESSPPADVLFRTDSWPEDAKVEALRVLVRAMGRVPNLERLFFKFQSAVTGSAGLVLRAFPDTPFVFLKRDPVEVMASLLGTYTDAMRRGADTGSVGHGHGTPCTRTIRSPPEGMASALGVSSEAELSSGGVEAFCAAHIGFIEVKAAAALEQAKEEAGRGERLGVGAAVDYKDLPAAVPGIARELFRVDVDAKAEAAMLDQATQYSKGTNKRSSTSVDESGRFKDDSKDKRRTAPAAIRDAALRFVTPRRAAIEAFTVQAAVALFPPKGPARPALDSPPMLGQIQKAVEESRQKQGALPRAELGSSKPAGSLVGKGKTDGTKKVMLEEAEGGPAAEPYPKLYPLPDILDAWSVDEPRVPESYGKFSTLRVFDFTDKAEVATAEAYREAEVPFVARGIPNLLRLRDEWSDATLAEKLPGTHHTEISPTNHFMYYHRGARGGTPYPIQTRDDSKTYAQWRKHAKEVDAKVLGGEVPNREAEHWYFRASGKHARAGGVRGAGPNGFITDGLKIFDRSRADNGDKADIATSSFFIVDPSAQRGIHCRFGQAGIVAEAHFDGGRNFIAMVRGKKRYVLSPPSECKNYNLLMDGPSARHSRTDWGDPEDYRKTLRDARALEVILEAGDALYVPSFWFHLPVSLETNIQCNTRSGSPPEGALDIQQCGFHVGTSEGSSRAPTPPAVAPVPAAPTPAPQATTDQS